MATRQCKLCGEHIWRPGDDYDDRCDDCRSRGDRKNEIREEKDNAPPEFTEGRLAYVDGKMKWMNPYINSNMGLEDLWESGWKHEQSKD